MVPMPDDVCWASAGIRLDLAVKIAEVAELVRDWNMSLSGRMIKGPRAPGQTCPRLNPRPSELRQTGDNYLP